MTDTAFPTLAASAHSAFPAGAGAASHHHLDDFLTSDDLARMLRLNPRAPETWRLKGTGPKFIRAGGRRVLYRWGDVLEYLDSRRFSSTSEEQAAA